jgi:hypothetical protein
MSFGNFKINFRSRNYCNFHYKLIHQIIQLTTPYFLTRDCCLQAIFTESVCDTKVHNHQFISLPLDSILSHFNPSHIIKISISVLSFTVFVSERPLPKRFHYQDLHISLVSSASDAPITHNGRETQSERYTNHDISLQVTCI